MIGKKKVSSIFLRIFLLPQVFFVDLVVVLVVLFLIFEGILPSVFAETVETKDRLNVVQEEQLDQSFSSPLLSLPSIPLSSLENSISKEIIQDIEKTFYISLIENKDNIVIVDLVFKYIEELDKDLIFALILNESRGDPKAVNINIDKTTGKIKSIDRGLFQLNSLSYPNLTKDQFYDIETNIRHGTAHIRGELVYWKGNEQKSLWSYNAGRGKVISNKVPKKTIEYADKIINQSKDIQKNREEYTKKRLAELLIS